ncbi:hypothetical protein GWK47_033906 [Chionoecetes opilio]|uniref:DUF7041 domain-containing protein n=1 Tax=Chionoecetes opilio TaxID=41210 RepID=A0A8J4YV44_CHIOP|nr:hypothetical protein GWK47_033906 [Chionoecetes opilio]
MATERLQLPSFHHNVQDWLLHVQGYLANTSANDQQKFNAVVCALPTEVATLLQSIITSPPDSSRFAALKSALLDVYRRPDHHHLQEMQTITWGTEAVYSVSADATNQYTVQHVIANGSASIHVSSEAALGANKGMSPCLPPQEVPPHYMRSLMSGDTTDDQHVCDAGLSRAETSSTPLRQILQRLDAIEERHEYRVPRPFVPHRGP